MIRNLTPQTIAKRGLFKVNEAERLVLTIHLYMYRSNGCRTKKTTLPFCIGTLLYVVTYTDILVRSTTEYRVERNRKISIPCDFYFILAGGWQFVYIGSNFSNPVSVTLRRWLPRETIILRPLFFSPHLINDSNPTLNVVKLIFSPITRSGARELWLSKQVSVFFLGKYKPEDFSETRNVSSYRLILHTSEHCFVCFSYDPVLFVAGLRCLILESVTLMFSGFHYSVHQKYYRFARNVFVQYCRLCAFVGSG